jgi:hypothetical protein
MQELGGVKMVVRGPIKVLGQVLVSMGVEVGVSNTIGSVTTVEEAIAKREHQMTKLIAESTNTRE